MSLPVALRTRSRALVALGGGLLGAFSLPPWGWWPLAVAGLGAFALATTDAAPRARAACGAAFGTGLFAIGLWWITEFHAVGFVLLLALETSFFAAGALLVTRPAAFPAAIVLAEAARGAVPFGGLPLGGLALGQAGGPFVAVARIAGALAVLGVVAAVGAAIASSVRGQRGVTAALVGGAVAMSALGWLAPADDGRGDVVDAVVVQGGGRRGFRAVDSDSAEVLAAHLAVSQDIEGPLELVVWPENAIDVDTIEGSVAGDELAELARRTDATVVAGVTQDAGLDGFENTAFAWSPEGRITDRYTKVRRVPFGEYVPMRGFIERLVDLSVLPRDAVAGTGSGAISTPAGRFAVAISYEVFFSDRVRSGVRDGGDLLLVPTNAASFSTSQVPTQEVAAARLRAWESGRWVLQAAPTGYSAVIDERGRVLARSMLGRAELLTADVPLRTGRTLYMRWGDGPVLLGALVLAIAVAARPRRRTAVEGSTV